MGQQESVVENQRFGKYLRRIREQRKLSLDAVEELSLGFPERVTKSHLSRIENGQAVPTFPRMFTLSQIYGVPVTSLAERFELELWRRAAPPDLATRDAEHVLAEARKMKDTGDYVGLLSLVTATLETRATAEGAVAEGAVAEGATAATTHHLRLFHIDALIHLERFETAKAECEKLLGVTDLQPRDRVLALLSFVICCYRLQRFTIARMGIEEAERKLTEMGDEPWLRAILETNSAAILCAIGQPAEAARVYERAVALYEAVPDPHEACRARANMAQALIDVGELTRATAALRAALRGAESGGYDRLAALAQSHLGLVAFKTGDTGSAESHFLRSNTVARPRQYVTLVFRNCYYLWLLARGRDDEAAIKANERTLRTYLSRIATELPEAEAFRAHLAGEKQ